MGCFVAGVQDWRQDFAAANPNLPRWFLDDRADLTARLAEAHMPVMLLWGDADPISPVRVGQRLASSTVAATTWASPMPTRWRG